jgi:hypothetical protein
MESGHPGGRGPRVRSPVAGVPRTDPELVLTPDLNTWVKPVQDRLIAAPAVTHIIVPVSGQCLIKG